MKKLILLLTILAIVLSLCITAFGVDTSTVTVKVNNIVISFPDDKPIIENGRTLVPVRFIAEALKYDVQWDNDTHTAIIDKGRIHLQIGNETITEDGKEKTIEVPAKIIGQRTYVPLRFLSENLNCSLDWFGDSKMVVVNANNKDGTEISFYDRLLQSGLFYECKPYNSDKYEAQYRDFSYLVLKSYMKAQTIDDAKKSLWRVEKNEQLIGNPDGTYQKIKSVGDDILIGTKDYSLKTRREIKKFLEVFYPTEYEEVYDLMMKTIRQEIWETYNPNDPIWDFSSGTYGTRYLDNREVRMKLTSNSSYFQIIINKTGFINPLKPQVPESVDHFIAEGNANRNSEGSRAFMEMYQLNIW